MPIEVKEVKWGRMATSLSEGLCHSEYDKLVWDHCTQKTCPTYKRDQNGTEPSFSCWFARTWVWGGGKWLIFTPVSPVLVLACKNGDTWKSESLRFAKWSYPLLCLPVPWLACWLLNSLPLCQGNPARLHFPTFLAVGVTMVRVFVSGMWMPIIGSPMHDPSCTFPITVTLEAM